MILIENPERFGRTKICDRAEATKLGEDGWIMVAIVSERSDSSQSNYNSTSGQQEYIPQVFITQLYVMAEPIDQTRERLQQDVVSLQTQLTAATEIAEDARSGQNAVQEELNQRTGAVEQLTKDLQATKEKLDQSESGVGDLYLKLDKLQKALDAVTAEFGRRTVEQVIGDRVLKDQSGDNGIIYVENDVPF